MKREHLCRLWGFLPFFLFSSEGNKDDSGKRGAESPFMNAVCTWGGILVLDSLYLGLLALTLPIKYSVIESLIGYGPLTPILERLCERYKSL